MQTFGVKNIFLKTLLAALSERVKGFQNFFFQFFCFTFVSRVVQYSGAKDI